MSNYSEPRKKFDAKKLLKLLAIYGIQVLIITIISLIIANWIISLIVGIVMGLVMSIAIRIFVKKRGKKEESEEDKEIKEMLKDESKVKKFVMDFIVNKWHRLPDKLKDKVINIYEKKGGVVGAFTTESKLEDYQELIQSLFKAKALIRAGDNQAAMASLESVKVRSKKDNLQDIFQEAQYLINSIQ